ncbi:tlde1 domain-containing protein [Noviherbaspirillum sp.]|uniref:tlde1 domain-containing protein n=1 Tax=Noviherbaspirillum sp. TaxID=1926288 RepID=UPI003FA5D94E
MGPLYDLFNGRREWFSLLADDGKIDDETFCDKVARTSFRLHPKGPSGESQGCIVIEEAHRFPDLRALLKTARVAQIPGSRYTTYARVMVR